MTKEELQSIINLLFTGKWNLSMQEARQIVEPLINKLLKEIDKLDKKDAPKK
jgi:hypothetical protein